MAIAEVGAGSQRTSTFTSSQVGSLALAFPGTVAAGNLLLVIGAGWKSNANGGAYSDVVVTDTLGTAYTVVLGSGVGWAAGAGRGFIAYGIAPSSGACTVTVNPSGGEGTIVFGIDEFSGVDATPLDINGGTSTGTSNAPSDGIVTGVDDALVVGEAIWASSSTTATPGAGYTNIYAKITNEGHPGAAAFKVAGAAGAETASWALVDSRAWAVHTLSFKPLPDGPFVFRSIRVSGAA